MKNVKKEEILGWSLFAMMFISPQLAIFRYGSYTEEANTLAISLYAICASLVAYWGLHHLLKIKEKLAATEVAREAVQAFVKVLEKRLEAAEAQRISKLIALKNALPLFTADITLRLSNTGQYFDRLCIKTTLIDKTLSIEFIKNAENRIPCEIEISCNEFGELMSKAEYYSFHYGRRLTTSNVTAGDFWRIVSQEGGTIEFLNTSKQETVEITFTRIPN